MGFYFTQYEDYKGLLDELRFWERAKIENELKTGWSEAVKGSESGLVGYFPMDEGAVEVIRDKLDNNRTIILNKATKESWSGENAPVKIIK